jgi:hypothetical protein
VALVTLVCDGSYVAIAVEAAIRRHEDGDVEHLGAWDVVTHDGTDVSSKRHRTREAAYGAFHRDIAARKAAGYVLAVDGIAVAPGSSTFASFPELERAIDDDPDDETSWAVLADAWSDAGDPRGACVHAERALVGIADPNVFMANKRAAADAHRARVAALFGPLGADDYRVQIEFRRGLVAAIKLDDEHAARGRPTQELIAQILGNPFARFAHKLEIRNAEHDAISAAGATQRHPALRALVVRETYEARPRGRVHFPLVLLDRAYPRLQALDLHVDGLDWRGAALPHVTELSINATFSLRDAEVFHAWLATHPAIERVEVRTHGIYAEQRPELAAIHAGWTAWPETLRRIRWNAKHTDR